MNIEHYARCAFALFVIAGAGCLLPPTEGGKDFASASDQSLGASDQAPPGKDKVAADAVAELQGAQKDGVAIPDLVLGDIDGTEGGATSMDAALQDGKVVPDQAGIDAGAD
jgi:hypothetical protein